ncbi:MAG: hypothetical protein J1G01_00165 [Clostridiales bacterium]|nr:hypothetical protein [Clostridiales bacterium]
MTVREIAVSAAVLLQADDIEDLLCDSETPEITDADVKALIECVHLAAAELAGHFPILKTVTAECDDRFIPLDVFDGGIATVKEVKKNGDITRFGFDSRGVRVIGRGSYEVTYTSPYAPVELDEDVQVGAGVDREMLTYLTVRNYCLITGRTDEAGIWDQRYNDEAESKRIERRASLPKRRWI